MKVTLLNTFDTGGGAANATLRLTRGLQNFGVVSELLVQFKTLDATDIFGPQTCAGKTAAVLRKHLDALPVRFYKNCPVSRFTPAIVPDNVNDRILSREPDLIHLNWLGAGFLRLESLAQFNKPLIWTLHDSWAFTGGCHLPFDCQKYREACGACPVLGSNRRHDLSRSVWLRKKHAWKGLNVTFVAPSRWIAECVRSSAMFKDSRIEVIPNGLDIALFRPCDRKTARRVLALPQDRKLILFGAVNSLSDRNKGYHLLLPALRKMGSLGWKERCNLLVFGASESAKLPEYGMESRNMGQLADDAMLRLLYAAADVFVAPSIQENLSTTVMEAMACGTPCVAYNIGGMPDLIEHGRNGYLAKPFEPAELANGISWVLDDETRGEELSRNVRYKIENEFAIDIVARRYAELYKDILS